MIAALRRTAPLLLAAIVLLGALPAAAQEAGRDAAGAAPQAIGGPVYLPLVTSSPTAPSPFGYDLRSWAPDQVMPYVLDSRPRWSRSGDLLWAQVEPVRGGGYRWEAMAALDDNIRRLRLAGIEPVVVVQWTPSWAQSVAGAVCSPPAPQYVADFVRFMAATAARYRGELQVDYWEIWNEPDMPIARSGGTANGWGCWNNGVSPYFGGDYYGAVLKQVYPAIKAANPRATVIAGALSHFWPNNGETMGFLRGMLESGAGASFDTLSFHAYNPYGAGDLLLYEANYLRGRLAAYGLSKPLMATEIAATCTAVQDPNSTVACTPDSLQKQANYAARIYALSIALDLQGALWYTLLDHGLFKPGFVNSHMIDLVDGKLIPRPAYYAFRNSAQLLQGARYAGPPVAEPPPNQLDAVQLLAFKRGSSVLYVFWVQQTDFPKVFNLKVPPGARAICTDQLNMVVPARYYCSDTNGDGVIPRAINELPQYVEILP